MGHTVRLMAPQFVKSFVKSNKNDAADAEAICEAVQRPSMRFVTPKSIEQQDIQCIHRIRSQAIKAQTMQINQITMKQQALFHYPGCRNPLYDR